MPNHYTNIVIAFRGFRDGFDDLDMVAELTRREWLTLPLQRVMPMPKELEGTQSPRDTPNWYDWQLENRGVKWDAYEVQPPLSLPGDSHAVQLTFCTAWIAPNEAVRDLLVRELLDEYGAGRVVWMGLNPYDDSFEVLGQWEWTPSPRPVDNVRPMRRPGGE